MKTTNIIRLGRYTIEYRPEVYKWEVEEGTAHRGLYDSLAKAMEFARGLA